jgi:hypothetical protein
MTAVVSALSAFYNEPLVTGDHEAHKARPATLPRCSQPCTRKPDAPMCRTQA